MSTASQEPNGELRRSAKTTMVVTVCGVCIAALVAMGGVVNWLNNLTGDIKQHEREIADIRQQNTRSIDDRVALLKQQEENKGVIAEIRQTQAEEKASKTAALQEVETQVDALSQSTNSRIAEIHRTMHIVFPRIGLGEYPDGPYTQPNISNRRPKD